MPPDLSPVLQKLYGDLHNATMDEATTRATHERACGRLNAAKVTLRQHLKGLGELPLSDDFQVDLQ